MSAHTLSSTYQRVGNRAGADGSKLVTGTFTATASYDTTGSTLDMSSIFASTVTYFKATTGNADFAAKWVPGTSNDSSDMKVFIDDDAGSEVASTTDISVTPGVFEWIAIGTDG